MKRFARFFTYGKGVPEIGLKEHKSSHRTRHIAIRMAKLHNKKMGTYMGGVDVSDFKQHRTIWDNYRGYSKRIR